MANYYTELSVMLPFPLTEEDDGEIKAGKWVEKWVEKVGAESMAAREEGDPSDSEDDPLFDLELEVQAGSDWDGVWLHGGDVGRAVDLIRRYLDDMDIEGCIFMSWACYCSKPRINEAMGGGAVIGRNGIVSEVNSYDAIREAEKNGAEVLNK